MACNHSKQEVAEIIREARKIREHPSAIESGDEPGKWTPVDKLPVAQRVNTVGGTLASQFLPTLGRFMAKLVQCGEGMTETSDLGTITDGDVIRAASVQLRSLAALLDGDVMAYTRLSHMRADALEQHVMIGNTEGQLPN